MPWPADGTILHHPVAHHIDPDQSSIARLGEWRTVQTHTLNYNMPALLRKALEHGDTSWRKVPLFTLDLPAVSQRKDLKQHKNQLSHLNDRLLADAGIINDKNTHIWRNYSDTKLAAAG
jgi:hypothetical protein